MLPAELGALVRRAERFLNEVEQRSRLLDEEECLCLAGLLVHLGASRYGESAEAMRRLETLPAVHIRGRNAATVQPPTIVEYRELLRLVRGR